MIDADALKKEFDLIASKSATGDWQSIPIKHIKQIIDNAPTVAINCKDCDGYEAGYSAGLNDAKRPQGEYVDISKLRLMTVEECAGHTIDYAMGWKACIEWIKKHPCIDCKNNYKNYWRPNNV